MAPAHITQGSSVTYREAPQGDNWPPSNAAWRIAIISAWAVGSRRLTGVLYPSAENASVSHDDSSNRHFAGGSRAFCESERLAHEVSSIPTAYPLRRYAKASVQRPYEKFPLGIGTGLILAILTGVVVVFSAIRLGDRRPTIPDGATLILNLNDDIPEKQPVQIPLPFVGSSDTITVLDTWKGLRAAATDSRVKAIVLETGHIGAGWGKAQEIREGLQAFKKSGKPLVAIMRTPRSREYISRQPRIGSSCRPRISSM